MNVSLIIITFLLTIFGTFVTRSGLIASVHAFGTSSVGYVFLSFLFVLIVFSGYLVYTRREDLKSRNRLDSLLSRESSFLFNNLILVGASFSILWGTLFPIISEAVRGQKVTVGPPYFNSVNVPIGIALILLTGIGPLIAWRKATFNNFLRNFQIPTFFSILVLIMLLAGGIRDIYPLLSYSLVTFVISGIVMEFYRGVKVRRRYNSNVFTAFLDLVSKFRRRYGGYIVHIGIMLIFIGITGSSAYKVEKEGHLNKGETLHIRNYDLTFLGVDKFNTANAQAISASIKVVKSGKNLGIYQPSKHYHPLQDQTMTEVSILSNSKEDLYLILGSVEDDGSIFLKAHINPLVAWIWRGSYVLILGTLIALWPPRKKKNKALATPVKSQVEIPEELPAI